MPLAVLRGTDVPRGPSFRQWLLAAFLLITAVLGGAAVQALFALEHVVLQSGDTARNAVQLTETVQRLAERTVAMERSARQYLVLEDPSLRERYRAAWQDAQALQRGLAGALGAAAQPAQADWATQAEAAWALLQRPARPRTAALDRLTPLFARLNQLNDTLATLGRGEVDRRNDTLLADLEQQRQVISGLVSGAIALAALCAFGFGHWLSRPIDRIEAAIARLGDNQFDRPVAVGGPADLRRLGRQLDWLRQRLAALESDKARFVRHISHELKTPLASIREGVALLQDGVAGTLTPDQAEIASILRGNTAALQNQIEALLRYQAMAFEAQHLRRQPTELQALLHRTAEAQRLQWQARGQRVTVEGGPLSATVDADTLAVALANLLSNALHFSPDGAEVRLSLARQSGQVAVDCIDQGPGVATEDTERIFDPFYQGRHQPPSARHGSGIGLSIVREVVQAHGGSVQLLASERGAHFRILLPMIPDDTHDSPDKNV